MLKKTISSIFIWDAMYIQENKEWFSKEKSYYLQDMFFGTMTVK